MKNLSLPLICMLLITIAFSCRDSKKKADTHDPEQFRELVSSYTSGFISSKSTLMITLAQKTGKFQPGTELPPDIITLDPEVDGKTYLIDPSTIEFRPEKPLKNGRQYVAVLNLKALLDVKKGQETFSFTVDVINQDFTVYAGELSAAGTPESPHKKYTGKMMTADEMQPDVASRILSAGIPGKSLKVEVVADGPREFTYTIDGIPRKEKSYDLTIYWMGDAAGVDKTGSRKVEIPGVDEFKLLQINTDQSAANQNIRLEFSDPVDPEQDLTGLIRIKDFDDIKLSLKGTTVTIYPEGRLYGEETIIVDKSIRNETGTRLEESAKYIVAMEALKPAVKILGNGVIMPDSKGLVLPFKTVSLRAVDVLVYKIFSENIMQFFQYNQYNGQNQLRYVARPVYRKMVRLDDNPATDLLQWNAFSVDLTGMAYDDKNAMYRVVISFRKDYSLYDCGLEKAVDLEAYDEMPLMNNDEREYYDGTEGYYNNYPSNYSWRDRDNPCTDSYYISSRFPERNLLASNLGVIAKSADGRHFTVAVTDLLNTSTVNSAEVEFFNLQQQKIGDGITGSDGIVMVSLDEIPYILRASHGDQQSWLRVDDGSSLSVSNFDVAGQKISDGIKGMIYGERGVWRPGDTLFLTFVMDDITNKLPENHPVTLELYNSRGQLAKRAVKTSGTDGFYVFKPVTDTEAPTGKWTARVNVGGASFNKTLNIETIKPNRLKINLDFNRDILIKNDYGQKATLDVKWLHGADAANLKAKVNVTLYASDFVFDGYEDFTFENPAKEYYPSENSIFDSRLDANGHASIPLGMQVNYGAPGMLKAVFNTRVFEEGGDFSTDVFSKPFAPFRRFVGIHVPEGGTWKNMLTTDTSHTVEVVAVDAEGNPVSVSDLKVRIYKVNWRWWWSSGSDNLASWLRGSNSEVVFRKTISTQNGKGSFDFKIDYPLWGRFFIEITDPDGGHTAGLPVYVDWPSYISRGDRTNPAGATILTINTDKDKYHPGDRARLTFPVSENARALVSLETGSEVLKYWWVGADELDGGFSFNVTGEMAPNVFAYITVVQPHAQTINDLPIRMYGVVPVMVEDPATILEPVIMAPDEIRPKTNYEIKVKEDKGQPMTYTLAVVDEGLLDLTRFKTPDLWNHFYAREALGVKTWDLFDEVLGAYGGRLQKVLAIGGDDEIRVDEDKKPNRFKPVVNFMGPIRLGKNETHTLQLSMPNYVGSVKLMLVAARDGAYGSVDSTVPVRQPLMVLPTAPRVIGPGEDFSLPVTVFAMKEGLKDVNVSVKTEGPVMTISSNEESLSFDKMGDKMAYFPLKTDTTEGNIKVTVTARSGSESASASIEMKVENPNDFITRVETEVLTPGETKTIGFDFFGTKGSNSGTIEVMTMPAFNLDKNLKYLIRYPYGCVEQITSSVFPQLYLDQLTELTPVQKRQINNNIIKAIQKLGRFQMANGAMSYWPGGSYISQWGSTYAWHFLLLAEKKGYLIPSVLKKRWLDWQFSMAADFDLNTKYGQRNWHQLAQSYRLYTLALAGKPNMSAMNQLREQENLGTTSRWRLAATYVLAGIPEAAEELIKNISYKETDTYETPGFTFGSSLRDKAMILEVLILMKKDEQAFDLAIDMASEMQMQYMSTQTAAFSLYAMASFAHSGGKTNDNHFTYEIEDDKKEINTDIPVYTIDISELTRNSINLSNLSENNLYVTKTISGKPLQGEEPGGSKNLEMDIRYVDIAGKELDVSNLKQGTDFEAVVTVKNPGRIGVYENLALSQIFPSGWEILNLRYTDAGESDNEGNYDFRDIRDDRVYTFFNLKSLHKITFRISLNAAYAGRFYMPGTTCHAMYDNRIYAGERGRWVEVVK